MMAKVLADDQWQISSKKTVPQIHLHNAKHDLFYKKRDEKIAKNHEKIQSLKKQISELEAKEWIIKDEDFVGGWSIEIEPSTSSYMTEEATRDQAEFYVKVTAWASIFKFEPKYEFKTVYQVDGKWYEVGVRIPVDETGKNMDESKTYFRKDEVIVQ